MATTINALLNTKANQSDITSDLASKLNLSDFNTALDLKADKINLTTLNDTVDALDANRTNNTDFNTLSNIVMSVLNQKADTDYVDDKVRKSMISILAEENGAINQNRYEWAFGSGTE